MSAASQLRLFHTCVVVFVVRLRIGTSSSSGHSPSAHFACTASYVAALSIHDTSHDATSSTCATESPPGTSAESCAQVAASPFIARYQCERKPVSFVNAYGLDASHRYVAASAETAGTPGTTGSSKPCVTASPGTKTGPAVGWSISTRSSAPSSVSARSRHCSCRLRTTMGFVDQSREPLGDRIRLIARQLVLDGEAVVHVGDELRAHLLVPSDDRDPAVVPALGERRARVVEEGVVVEVAEEARRDLARGRLERMALEVELPARLGGEVGVGVGRPVRRVRRAEVVVLVARLVLRRAVAAVGEVRAEDGRGGAGLLDTDGDVGRRRRAPRRRAARRPCP